MKQGNQLPLERCPHCNVAKPMLSRVWGASALKNFAGTNQRFWSAYICSTCGGVVLVCTPRDVNEEIVHIWPEPDVVAEELPVRAREFLSQAIASQLAPAGAIMLTASAVDAMLKDKGYKEGNLKARINHAAADHLITAEMAAWAHEIRLDANDQRHADENAELPTSGDAERVIEFARALAQFLYVLPARVARGRELKS